MWKRPSALKWARRSTIPFLAAAVVTVFPAQPSGGTPATPQPAKPTIVLEHGAFADGSGWVGEIRRLQHDGYRVIAPANPERDLASDAAYLDSVLATLPGPVVLVGHSYGGAVISNTHAANVRALVYIAGFALDQGESLASIGAQFPGSRLPASIAPRPYPGGVDLYIAPDQFHDVFAGDLPAKAADALAATQRPLSLAAFTGTSGEPAWRTVPAWYMVATEDHAIPPEAERFMARRASADTVEVKASHAVLISQPRDVVDLIETAARSASL